MEIIVRIKEARGPSIKLMITSLDIGALIAAIPLIALKHGWRPYVAGFLIGFTTSLILYLTHPIASLIRLANIVGELAGLPGPLMLIIYPLIYGTLMALASGAYVAIKTLISRDN